MKNKFCESCRANIGVEEGRVRAVAFDLSSEFYNTSMSGFWNSSHRVPGRRVLALSHGCPSPRSSTPPPTPIQVSSTSRVLSRRRFRLINQTAHCRGPRLVLFEEAPPDFDWSPIPAEWARRAGSERVACCLLRFAEEGWGEGRGGKASSPGAQRLVFAWRGVQARAL